MKPKLKAFFTFKDTLAPSLIRFSFWIGLLGFFLIALQHLLRFFQEWSYRGSFAEASKRWLLSSALWGFLVPIGWRILSELLLVVFAKQQSLKAIEQSLGEIRESVSPKGNEKTHLSDG